MAHLNRTIIFQCFIFVNYAFTIDFLAFYASLLTLTLFENQHIYGGKMLKQPFKLVERDEELELYKRWKNFRDIRARDRLIFSCTAIVRQFAKKYSFGNTERFQELFQEGNLGLLKGFDKFDPAYGYRFLTYMSWWIRAQMQYHLRANPNNEESLDVPARHDTDETFKDLLTDPNTGPEHLLGIDGPYDLFQLRQAINSLLRGNELKVIKLRYYSGDDLLSLEETGTFFSGRDKKPLSRERMRQIEKVSINKLRAGLQNWEEKVEWRRTTSILVNKPTSQSFAQIIMKNNPKLGEKMARIPDEVVLRCLEKIGGKENFFSSFELTDSICEDEWGKNYSGIITNRLIGQALRALVKKGLIEKKDSEIPRKYRISKIPTLTSAGSKTPNKILSVPTAKPPELAPTSPDLVFQVAIAMLRIGDDAAEEATTLSSSLRELVSALKKIPAGYRERALLIAKKLVK